MADEQRKEQSQSNGLPSLPDVSPDVPAAPDASDLSADLPPAILDLPGMTDEASREQQAASDDMSFEKDESVALSTSKKTEPDISAPSHSEDSEFPAVPSPDVGGVPEPVAPLPDVQSADEDVDLGSLSLPALGESDSVPALPSADVPQSDISGLGPIESESASEKVEESGFGALPPIEAASPDEEGSGHKSIVPEMDDSGTVKIKPAKNNGKKDPYLGQSFGGYQLVERIGHGGMGTVYKGRQVSLDREVAIKILNPQLVDNDEFIKRFQREAKSVARIMHPNIVAVHDFGQSKGIYYMVIEYVGGTSLSRMISEKLMLTLDEIAPIMIDCLAGLDHIASSGVIHRDIKPDNILMDEAGIAKLADFGLAKNVESGDTDLTAHGSAMGTPAYMSPEQCMGRNLDVRSDIYALGVTAYYALVGEKPFTGQSSFEIMTKHREEPPKPLYEVNPQISREVSDLVLHMLAKKPVERFADANECKNEWLRVAEQADALPDRYQRSPSQASIQALPDEAAAPEPPVTGLPPITPASTAKPSTDSLPPALDSTGAQGLASLPPQSSPPSVPDMTGAQSTRRGSEIIEQDFQGDKGSEERFRRRSSALMNAWTCPKCGNLNKGTDDDCQRCGYSSNENGPSSGTDRERRHQTNKVKRTGTGRKDRESDADRLMDKGKFKDAMSMYARLADQSQDRRHRSVLRSKEREARNKHEDAFFDEVNTRSNNLIGSGRYEESLQLLERSLDDSKSATLSARFTTEIRHIRSRVRAGKRKRIIMILAILIVIAAVVAGIYFSEEIKQKIEGMNGNTTETEAGQSP